MPIDEGAEKAGGHEGHDDRNLMEGVLEDKPALASSVAKVDGKETKAPVGKTGGGKKKKGKR